MASNEPNFQFDSKPISTVIITLQKINFQIVQITHIPSTAPQNRVTNKNSKMKHQ